MLGVDSNEVCVQQASLMRFHECARLVPLQPRITGTHIDGMSVLFLVAALQLDTADSSTDVGAACELCALCMCVCCCYIYYQLETAVLAVCTRIGSFEVLGR